MQRDTFTRLQIVFREYRSENPTLAREVVWGLMARQYYHLKDDDQQLIDAALAEFDAERKRRQGRARFRARKRRRK